MVAPSLPAYRLFVAALLLVGLSGIAGGIPLILEPSGARFGLEVEWLEGSPFTDYRIPGILILPLFGALPLLAVHGLWRRRQWGWLAGMAVGVVTLVWLGVEVLVIGYHAWPPPQLAYAVLGLLILGLGAMPSVRHQAAR